MLLVVTGVGSAIHVYSLGYMKGVLAGNIELLPYLTKFFLQLLNLAPRLLELILGYGQSGRDRL